MPDTPLEFIALDPDDPEPASLIALLDAELRGIYPGDPVYGIKVEEFRRTGGVFLIGRLEGVAVACGAVRFLEGGIGEVKRMYVRKEHRGRGFSRTVLEALEKIARERGYRTMRIETGCRQPEAIGLYESAGYRRIPCFGEYALDPTSVCFDKSLGE